MLKLMQQILRIGIVTKLLISFLAFNVQTMSSLKGDHLSQFNEFHRLKSRLGTHFAKYTFKRKIMGSIKSATIGLVHFRRPS
jgi:hypothetical protein